MGNKEQTNNRFVIPLKHTVPIFQYSCTPIFQSFNKDMKKTGSQIVVEALKKEGVDTF